MDYTFELLKELTEANGVPGYEAPVRAVVRKYLEPYGELTQDKMGSVICRKAGSSDSPRIMLVGHMDEIGFMIKHITKEGFIRFLPLGGWFDQVLLGQRVVIQTQKGEVVGVIGAKPPHLLTSEERNKVVLKKDMYIDIGATSQEEVEAAGVRPGDPVVPRADFVPLATQKTYLSKAFDDRVGVAMLISTFQALKDQPHPNTIYGVASVQEEVGLRGATTSARAVDPHLAVVLESDIAGDVPGIKPEESAVRLGSGPSVLIFDSRMIPNIKLRNLVMQVAETEQIAVQASYVEGGGTDGGAIHLHGTGVPTIVIGVPARHIHSHSSIIHRDDYDNAIKLIAALMNRLDSDTVSSLTE
jgi:putative aminopeptidase FrvX